MKAFWLSFLSAIAAGALAAAAADTVREAPRLPGDREVSPPNEGACVTGAKNKPGYMKPLAGSIIVVEAEKLLNEGKVTVSGGTIGVQQMSTTFGRGWGEDAQVFWNAGRGAVMELSVPVLPGTWHVYVLLTRAPDFGEVEMKVQDRFGHWTYPSTFDAWASKVEPPAWNSPVRGNVPLAQGDTKISLKITGKNRASTGTAVGIDCIALRFVHV